jgi:hypothetical protein
MTKNEALQQLDLHTNVEVFCEDLPFIESLLDALVKVGALDA